MRVCVCDRRGCQQDRRTPGCVGGWRRIRLGLGDEVLQKLVAGGQHVLRSVKARSPDILSTAAHDRNELDMCGRVVSAPQGCLGAMCSSNDDASPALVTAGPVFGSGIPTSSTGTCSFVLRSCSTAHKCECPI